ncbi:MAG: alpha/beta hydrolase fold domain-containing protein [Candidatus Helarchaeota archaeon]
MNVRKIVKYLVLIIGYLILIIGLYTGLVIATGKLFTIIDTAINCILPALGCISYIFFPIVIIIMVRLHGKKKKLWVIPIVFGVIVTSLNALPVLAGWQKPILDGDAQFEAKFGSNYMDKIDPNLRAKFKQSPFDFWRMYFGYETYECNVSENEGPYYIDPVSNDKFYFDYYSPAIGTGPFPVIINIHGGGWVIGNKGLENLVYISRYFAHQGYVVFDIQYGLAHFPGIKISNTEIDNILSQVQGLLGRSLTNKSYAIPEIIRQVVGNFTDYIVAHSTEYKINTSCVFITGLSAGGHLTETFIGWNTTWKNIFNDTLKIRGIIPRYGVSNMAKLISAHKNDPLFSSVDNPDEMITQLVGGDPEENDTLNRLVSPVYYVDSSAPPCLIIHGSNDKMVPIEQAYDLKAAYDANATNPCILIEFPFHGHFLDALPGSIGCQIMIYYMERFMGLMQHWEVA